VPQRHGWEARHWSRIQGAEHLATRDRVALFNLSAFTKIEVSGPGAAGFLQWLAANDVDQPVGKIVYTSLCTSRGGIMADLTITRLAADRFWILTGGSTGPHDLAWIRRHTPGGGAVHIQDMSGQFVALGLWGPRSRDVLAQVAEEDVSTHHFRYYWARPLRIDVVPAMALRLSYAGELGWEIYAPVEYGQRLWDVLWEAGQPYGMIAAGAGAFDSLRLEKGYRLWGADIHTEYNPYEAGLGWAVKLDKGDFMGCDALLRVKEQGIARRLCCLTFDDPAAMALGKEPILADGRVLGFVTSANYGYSLGKLIAYGYLPTEYAKEGTVVEVQCFGRRFAATVAADPLFDPKMARLRA
ncbi:MAG: aminomethyl transferase family protein, partial [Caldilineaceae bacterium]|nr:aminomethyl transferase family protein [Caldilineaceae bacterium]